jgi:hypothetical protein
MSDVDRLSNSGLYPVLPIADKPGSGSKESPGRGSRDGAAASDKPSAKNPDPAAAPRPPKSLIDEYA